MKKKLMAVALATIIAVMAVAGASLAWLKDSTDTVINTFTEGKVDIELAETPTANGSATANSYKMVPGDVLPKDPKVSVVAGSEACWLFVEIEEVNDVDNFLTYAIASGWTYLVANSDDDVAGTSEKYVIYREVSATDAANGISYYILDGNEVTVNTDVEMDDMEVLYGDTTKRPQLKFTAYAIQSANIADVATAWDEVK